MMISRSLIEFPWPKLAIGGFVLAIAIIGTPVRADEGPVITQINHS
ncbi:uncharacterized protein METZ01_LOCUS394578, partial [marine metagenome]